MGDNKEDVSSRNVRLRDALGADKFVARQRFGIYLPNKDRHGNAVKDIDDWVRKALLLLGRINGGATAFPPTEGIWLDDNDAPLFEQTIFVYSFINANRFLSQLHLICAYLHQFGRLTNQGEVLVEFENLAFHITSYDPAVAS